MNETITYKHMGGDQWFTFQCDKTGCGTVSEEGKPCPRCGHTVMKVYAKLPKLLQ